MVVKATYWLWPVSRPRNRIDSAEAASESIAAPPRTSLPPLFRRRFGRISRQPRGNPRTVTSAHRTTSIRLVRMRCEKVRIPRGDILRRCRHADRWYRPALGNCGRFRGGSVRARRKDTWWRGWLRARACRKHRAGSGPLPRQIQPTPQRRRCGRGRGRGPAGRSGRTDAARRSIPRA